MTTPPFLMGMALLFWGWRTELMIWAIPLAIVLEASHFIRARWELSDTDLRRIWDLCMVLTLGEVVFLVSAQRTGQMSFKFFQLLPFPLFLLMLAQAYGNRDKIPLVVFSFIVRRMRNSPLANMAYNATWFYFVVCMVGASSTFRETPYFYPAVAVLVSWALMAVRPRRVSLAVWIVLASLALGSGFMAQRGLFLAQNSLEASFMRWVMNYFRRDLDVRETRTAIGRLGRLKLSGKIVLRVTPEANSPPPGLLQEASYDSYQSGVWHASVGQFAPATVDTNDNAFLLPTNRIQFQARIAGYMNGGRGVLSLPHGTFELHDMPATTLTTNRFGVARVDDAPEFLNFLALYGPGNSLNSPPSDADLFVPLEERPALEEIIKQLKIDGKTDTQKVQAICAFFQNNFTYSQYIGQQHIDRTGTNTSVALFLTRARSGHCEYFATATVLLLRQAKIPARYAVGYSVQEKSGNTYIVRERHGHAWTLAYHKGTKTWGELDTTPASWNQIESERASTFESISDLFSRLQYEFSKWRDSKTSYSSYLRWLLVPLVALLVWRVVFRQSRRRASTADAATGEVWPGQDSDFYRILERCERCGMTRLPNELPHEWVRRLALPQPERLELILQLHSRLRFDPKSLSPDERNQLKQEVESWMAEAKIEPGTGKEISV